MTPEYKKSKVGFPIRKSSDQSSFAAPQGLSQRTTSFIASQRQGIHRMLLRHLITLMIGARLGRARDAIKERPVFELSLEDVCLPNMPGPDPAGVGIGWRTRSLTNRACSLFTISNIRASLPCGRGANLCDTGRHACDGLKTRSAKDLDLKKDRRKGSGGACRDRTDDLKLAKLPLSQLS
jgi:hypothetical protein